MAKTDAELAREIAAILATTKATPLPHREIMWLKKFGGVQRGTREVNEIGARLLIQKREKAAKKAVREEGECQICAARCAIVRGKTSLHGYNRPGIGYVVGRCYGAQHLPFEVSCDRLKSWVGELRSMLSRNEDALASFESLTSFEVAYQKIEEGKRGLGVVTKYMNVGPDDERYPKAKARARVELENRIDSLRSDITMQEWRLKDWAPKAS